jgi:hypothetical protein
MVDIYINQYIIFLLFITDLEEYKGAYLYEKRADR